MIFLPYEIALLLNHRFQLLDGDVRESAQLQVFLFDVAVQPLDLFAVRARRHLYIRIELRRRYAGRGRRRSDGFDRLVQKSRAAPKIERTFLPLAHLPSPQLAKLVVAREELRVAEAATVVAHLQLAELVDVDLEQTPLVHRRKLLDAREELVVLVLQLADVLFELVQLVVLFDHGSADTIRAHA